MAAVAPVILTIDALPLPMKVNEVPWKQYLFYMIAYCDTYHDFAKERKLEGEGRSVSKADIRDRVQFTLDLIKGMDDSLPFNMYFNVINSLRTGTFENNVYSAFTRVLNNPLLAKIDNNAIRSNIQGYLRDVFSLLVNQELNQQSMNEKAFQMVPTINSPIIELYMPAVVYSDTIQDNLINFLKAAYPDCVDSGIIKFVEDTASFPRNIFTTKLSNFNKVVTTQTKWDPAGLSKFDYIIPTSDVVSAPSFRATQKASSPQATFNYSSAYFNQRTDEIMYLGGTHKITKAGPSVNHLFMHMALEGDASIITPQLQAKFKVMINAAKKDSKKNMVLPLNKEAGNPAGKDTRLRELTSSKRSGDYENIHSAIHTSSLMFTGDEPAFTYAILNKCPVVFHSTSSSGHHFKLYIPANKDPAIAAAAAAKREILAAALKAAELQKFFGGADMFYKSYLTNLKTAVFSSANISVYARADVGRILQVYMAKDLETYAELFDALVNARTLFRNMAGNIPLANVSLIDINKLQGADFSNVLISKLLKIGLGDLESRNAILEAKLSEIRKYIPLKFHQTLTVANAIDATLFKPNTTGLPLLINGTKRYNLEPGAMFPYYKNLEGNIGGISKLLNTNGKITNQTLIRKNNEMVEDTLEYLGMPVIPDAATAAASTMTANALIDRWLVAPAAGGHMEVELRRATTKRMRNNSFNIPVKLNTSRKRIRNTVSENTYVTLHNKLSRLDPSKIPFKLTPQEYADMIVYRLVINDVIMELTSDEPMAPVVESNTEMSNDPQLGGAVMTPTMLSHCMDLFNNQIEPFFRKHLDGTTAKAEDMLISVLRSVVGGTFIQDIEMLLNEISSSPEIPGDANSALYEAMKTGAANTLNGIFNMLDRSYSDPTRILKINERHEGISFDDIKSVLTYYSTGPIITDRFFDDMNKIVTYINNLFLEDVSGAVTRCDAEAAMLAIPDDATIDNKDALQNYVKYALNDYLEVEILGVPLTGPDATRCTVMGGSRSRDRRKKHKRGSPRRRSLKHR